MAEITAKPLSGRVVLCFILGGFGIILAANLTLAYFAFGSFPGLEVKNTYVASQSFDARRKAQESLGWKCDFDHHDHQFEIRIRDKANMPIKPEKISLRITAAAMASSEKYIPLTTTKDGYMAMHHLPSGNWIAHIEAISDQGIAFIERHRIIIP